MSALVADAESSRLDNGFWDRRAGRYLSLECALARKGTKGWLAWEGVQRRVQQARSIASQKTAILQERHGNARVANAGNGPGGDMVSTVKAGREKRTI